MKKHAHACRKKAAIEIVYENEINDFFLFFLPSTRSIISLFFSLLHLLFQWCYQHQLYLYLCKLSSYDGFVGSPSPLYIETTCSTLFYCCCCLSSSLLIHFLFCLLSFESTFTQTHSALNIYVIYFHML